METPKCEAKVGPNGPSHITKMVVATPIMVYRN